MLALAAAAAAAAVAATAALPEPPSARILHMVVVRMPILKGNHSDHSADLWA
jgi:Spy/CpxP family protein refolding chaperone